MAEELAKDDIPEVKELETSREVKTSTPLQVDVYLCSDSSITFQPYVLYASKELGRASLVYDGTMYLTAVLEGDRWVLDQASFDQLIYPHRTRGSNL